MSHDSSSCQKLRHVKSCTLPRRISLGSTAETCENWPRLCDRQAAKGVTFCWKCVTSHPWIRSRFPEICLAAISTRRHSTRESLSIASAKTDKITFFFLGIQLTAKLKQIKVNNRKPGCYRVWKKKTGDSGRRISLSYLHSWYGVFFQVIDALFFTAKVVGKLPTISLALFPVSQLANRYSSFVICLFRLFRPIVTYVIIIIRHLSLGRHFILTVLWQFNASQVDQQATIDVERWMSHDGHVVIIAMDNFRHDLLKFIEL